MAKTKKIIFEIYVNVYYKFFFMIIQLLKDKWLKINKSFLIRKYPKSNKLNNQDPNYISVF